MRIRVWFFAFKREYGVKEFFLWKSWLDVEHGFEVLGLSVFYFGSNGRFGGVELIFWQGEVGIRDASFSGIEVLSRKGAERRESQAGAQFWDRIDS